MKKILITILLLISPILVMAQSNNNTSEVLPNLDNNPTNTSVLNDQLRQMESSIQALNNGVDINSFTTGILDTDRGGTGEDFSNVAANTIPYFSSLGVMGNIGIGTTGYYLTAGSPPNWTPPPVLGPKTLISVWQDNIGVSSSGIATHNIVMDSGTDWAGKNITLIVNVETEQTDSFTTTQPNITNTSTTALSGMQYAHSAPAGAYQFFLTSLTLPTNSYAVLLTLTGTYTKEVGIGTNSSGNLVMVTYLNANGTGTETAYSQIIGTILRTP